PAATPDGDWQQIVIFLSVADVHINRAPYGGTVSTVIYRPGRFLAAFTPESGSENERSEITVVRDLPGGGQRTVVFRQIVGMFARRVVTRVEPGDLLQTGQRIGLMKFGSRMDLFLPHEVELSVVERQRVVGGETVLGRWPEPSTLAADGS
ncbi:MAG TPA: phosphatidylserine decarboxylase, partial [Aquihabitans sp.]|nr:phosphatidylserine decarboxylase [Aquihabitans sp.]